MKIKQLLQASIIVATGAMAIPSMSWADDDQKINMANVVINMPDAITIALGRVAGTVVEAELESEDDMAVWEISVMGENDQVSEIEVDANTGAILEVEVEDD